MENATKALLIAAGALFAVVIISIVWIAYGNLTGYYNAKQDNINQEQLSAFNNEYAAYDRELTGFELISLINKVSDYDKNKADAEGYARMTVNVKIPQNTKQKYNGDLFNNKNKEVNLTYSDNIIAEPSKNDEAKYEDFLTFKRSKFQSHGSKYENGQIVSFSYTQQ